MGQSGIHAGMGCEFLYSGDVVSKGGEAGRGASECSNEVFRTVDRVRICLYFGSPVIPKPTDTLSHSYPVDLHVGSKVLPPPYRIPVDRSVVGY